MDEILYEEIGISCYVYLDDIIVFGKTSDEHDKHLITICKKLEDNDVKINMDKWQFKKEEIDFLGFTISDNTYKIMQDKIKALDLIKRPTTIKQLQKFLGFCNYFRKFIENYANITDPLYKLTSIKTKFKCESIHEDTFNKLITILKSPKILTIPNFENDFILYTDASNGGLGAIL